MNTKFSEFIRNASEEEKRETYMRVLDQAEASELRLILTSIKQKSIQLMAFIAIQFAGVVFCFIAWFLNGVEVIPADFRTVLASLIPVIWVFLLICVMISWDLIDSTIIACQLFTNPPDQE